MALAVPEYRYICEDTWDKEFELAHYSDNSDQLQADHTSWDKMLEFSKKLAVDYELPEDNWYRFLWTSFDGDDGTIYLKNGTKFVNRLDFWFSKKPWGIDNNKKINDLTMIEVAWEDQEDCKDKELDLEKFECDRCGCYYWVENRSYYSCPNCKENND